MKFNNRVINRHSYLYEVTRKNLVGKTKAQSPDRYKRSVGYFPSDYSIDLYELLSTDELVVKSKVGDYECIIAYQGILEELKKVLKSQPRPNVTLQTIIKTLQRSIDNGDIKLDCDCADWKYRFAYWATKYDYKYGKPENRPADKTNPDDKLGSCCKHLSRLLKDKRWLVKLASILNDLIKTHLDEFREAMGLDEDEMFINMRGRPSDKTGRNTRMLKKQDKSVVVDDSDEEENAEENSENTDEIVDIGDDSDGSTDEE